MMNSDQSSETLFVIENPEMEALAKELVQLTPDFKAANADTQRSLEILQTFYNAGLSAFEKKEILGFVRHHWGAATTKTGLENARKLMPAETSEQRLPQRELVV